MTTEIETLYTLATAASKSFTLDLATAYKTLPKEHITSLIKQGLWYFASTTQGNLTDKGAETLIRYRERANNQAVVDALIEDAAKLGLQVKLTSPLGFVVEGKQVGDGETFEVTMKDGFVLTLSRAETALFLIEERLVQAGKVL